MSTPTAESTSDEIQSQSKLNLPELPDNEITRLREAARQNLVAFRHLILENTSDNVDPAPFHYDWSESILEGTGHEAWECFRESAKGQYIVRSFEIYQLAFPSEKFDYIIIIKNNATVASAKLKEIANEFISNKIASSNLVKIIQQSADAFHVETTDITGKVIETRIEAYGKGASVRGASYQDRRPRICIIDDPQDAEDAKSDVILENDWKWFLDDVLFLGQKTRIFLIGNNLGDKCILERVIRNADALKFKTNRVPVEIDGEPTWPSKFTKEFIATEKESYRRAGQLDIWLKNRMCQSTSEETRTFNLNDFPRFSFRESNSIAKVARISATLDPAASTTKAACFRAICINAVTVENYWMILEILYGRWDSTVLIDKIFQVVAKWDLKFFGIEKGMLYDFMEPIIRAEMIRRKIFFELIPLEHGKKGTKLERIKMLAPRSKAKQIWFPDYAEPIDGNPSWITELELEITGITKDEIKSEYVDLLDALAMQDQIATAPSVYGNPRTPGAAGRYSRPPIQRTYRTGPRIG